MLLQPHRLVRSKLQHSQPNHIRLKICSHDAVSAMHGAVWDDCTELKEGHVVVSSPPTTRWPSFVYGEPGIVDLPGGVPVSDADAPVRGDNGRIEAMTRC